MSKFNRTLTAPLLGLMLGLSLFTSSAFAQSVNQSTSNRVVVQGPINNGTEQGRDANYGNYQNRNNNGTEQGRDANYGNYQNRDNGVGQGRDANYGNYQNRDNKVGQGRNANYGNYRTNNGDRYRYSYGRPAWCAPVLRRVNTRYGVRRVWTVVCHKR